MPEKKPQTVKDQIESQSETKAKARRKILRTLVAGGGAVTAAKITSEDWVKPVVDSVMLPSHAQTSLAGAAGPGGNFTSGAVVVGVQADSDTLLAEQPLSNELLEFFMPSAQAQTCNISCNVEFGLAIDSDFSSGFVCVSGDSSGSASLNGVTATGFTGASSNIGDFIVGAGTFAGGTWTMTVINMNFNLSSDVMLSSGSAACAMPG